MLFFSSRSRIEHGLSFHNYIGEFFGNILKFLNNRTCDSEAEPKPFEGTEFANDATVGQAGSQVVCVKPQC
nr:unnamed protein product [Haemonchus contortus]